MRTDRKHYVISAGTDLPFAEAVNRARNLLREAGYVVLCEMLDPIAQRVREDLGGVVEEIAKG